MINVVSISAGNRDTHVRPDLSALCPQEAGKDLLLATLREGV
jgi:hypothetical protein